MSKSRRLNVHINEGIVGMHVDVGWIRKAIAIEIDSKWVETEISTLLEHHW